MSKKKRSYTMIKEFLTVPGSMPQVLRILRVTTLPVITRTVSIRKKVVFWGDLHIDVEYAAMVSEKSEPVYFASFQTSFCDLLYYRKAKTGMMVNLTSEVEFQECSLLDSRTICIVAIVRLRAIRVCKLTNVVIGRRCCETMYIDVPCTGLRDTEQIPNMILSEPQEPGVPGARLKRLFGQIGWVANLTDCLKECSNIVQRVIDFIPICWPIIVVIRLLMSLGKSWRLVSWRSHNRI